MTHNRRPWWLTHDGTALAPASSSSTTNPPSCGWCRRTWADMTFVLTPPATAARHLMQLGGSTRTLILLDLGLPDIDGLEVLQSIRKRGNTPVVVLSARGAEQDKVVALDAGADDYLTKPFGINELLARVRVALRHAAAPVAGLDPVIKLGELEVNLERRRIGANGVDIHLTPTEWDLVKLFATNPDKVLTDRMIMQSVWGAAFRVAGALTSRVYGALAQEVRSTARCQAAPVDRNGRGLSLCH